MQKIGKHKYVKCRFERYRKLHLVYIIQKLKAQLQIFHKEQLQNQKHNLQKSKMVYTRHRDNQSTNGSMSLVGCGDETITVRVLCKVL